MATVELRDIVSEDDDEAVMGLRRGPGRTRPNATVLWTSCKPGEGSPQPFYLRYGFRLTGERKWGEDLLRLDLGGGQGTIGGRA